MLLIAVEPQAGLQAGFLVLGLVELLIQAIAFGERGFAGADVVIQATMGLGGSHQGLVQGLLGGGLGRDRLHQLTGLTAGAVFQTLAAVGSRELGAAEAALLRFDAGQLLHAFDLLGLGVLGLQHQRIDFAEHRVELVALVR